MGSGLSSLKKSSQNKYMTDRPGNEHICVSFGPESPFIRGVEGTRAGQASHGTGVHVGSAAS
jgi:hypothetical protein